jgi:GNAT superfamily N-acetyltransferase
VTADKPICRWATPEDLPRLEAFWRKQFGDSSIQALPGRCAWLFAGQPQGLQVALAEADGNIVSACGHLVTTIDLQDVGPQDAAFAVDFIISPDYRRRGLGSQILDLRLERFPLVLSTGQSPAMSALYRERGALDLGQFQVARSRHSPRLVGPPRAILRDLFIWRAGRRRRSVQCRRNCLDAQSAYALAAAPEWLAWRFSGPVYTDHDFWRLEANGNTGLLVSRRDQDTEVLLHVDSVAPRAQLLAAAAVSSPAPAVSALFAGNRLAKDFAAAGWMLRPWGAHLVGMTQRDDLSRVLLRGNVDLFASASDADLLRRPAGLIVGF